MSGAGFTIIAVSIVLAACVQASIGFGMGMLAAPVIALIDPTLLPGTIVMLAALITLMVVVRERKHLDLRGTWWALAGRLPGTAAGAALVAWLPPRALAVLVAVVVLGGVAMAATGWAPSPRPFTLVSAGTISGLMGTATSIGGPPMALVWQGLSGPRLRGTMSAFFLTGSVLSILALTVSGAIDGTTLGRTLLLLPAVAAGYGLSRLANRWLDPGRLRTAAIVVSVLGALVLLVAQLG
ncbi:sulfite exporter TauE/SafE family protein [Nonomuraea sp. NPDC050153]|uniref:sulfite exporter TauE/SafE family protein n=1 Tax=Nonomuraea sp. NPDC050153 TaxID=3364359 RepID=UPI0037B44BA7